MTTDLRTAREREAMRRQGGIHLEPDTAPDAAGMGAESAEYTKPTIDPQWMAAWKLFLDPEGNEYGVQVMVPRLQWDNGGANALVNLKRPDGGFWFTLVEPERKSLPPRHACFVGDCQKKVDTLIKLVKHIKAFHFDEADMYKTVLEEIEKKVAHEDPRLQAVLNSLNKLGQEELGSATEEGVVACHECGAIPPEDHKNPEGWLRGHMMGAHKEGKDD